MLISSMTALAYTVQYSCIATLDKEGLEQALPDKAAWIIAKTADGKTAATARIDKGGDYFRKRGLPIRKVKKPQKSQMSPFSYQTTPTYPIT